jgi:hypothetical protein
VQPIPGLAFVSGGPAERIQYQHERGHLKPVPERVPPAVAGGFRLVLKQEYGVRDLHTARCRAGEFFKPARQHRMLAVRRRSLRGQQVRIERMPEGGPQPSKHNCNGYSPPARLKLSTIFENSEKIFAENAPGVAFADA